MHGDSSLVTLWWSDWLQFALDFDWANISSGLFLSKFDVKKKHIAYQTHPNYPYFVSHMSHPSSLGSIAGEILEKERRKEKT